MLRESEKRGERVRNGREKNGERCRSDKKPRKW